MFKTPNKYVYYALWLLACLATYMPVAQSQANLGEKEHLNRLIHKVKYKGKNAAELATLLTKGAATDKEKFDALYVWVVTNLRYDYDVYYSAGGTEAPDIIKTLDKRKGVCVDYAALMDTLCTMAGLQNLSVSGYAKDEIFDVDDSLYISNHVWNAVKLDNEWYVYDATWSSYSTAYKYTRLGNLIIRLKERFNKKYKTVRIKPDKKMYYCRTCPGKPEPAYYFKQRLLNKVLLRFLSKFKPRIVKKYIRGLNSDYYIGDPVFFAITHFPDNSYWALLPGKTLRHFERDSAFYHFTDSNMWSQEVKGSVCKACDAYMAMTDLQKEHEQKRTSYENNPRNRFIKAHCNYNIGALHYNQSVLYSDSLTRISLTDSALLYYEMALNELEQQKASIAAEHSMQKSKNRHKQKLLLADNKHHSWFIRRKISITGTEQRGNKALLNVFLAAGNKQCALENTLSRRKAGMSPPKKEIKAGSRVEKLRQEIIRLKHETDSLEDLLNSQQKVFDSLSSNLSLSVWQKALYHNELISPFYKSSFYRSVLQDNYKKPVVELRRIIYAYENSYETGLNEQIYYPSRSCDTLGRSILKLILATNSHKSACLKKTAELIKKGAEDSLELVKEQDAFRQYVSNNACWLQQNGPRLLSASMGFDLLAYQQQLVQQVINLENNLEQRRFMTINRELQRRKKKYNNIVAHNSHFLRKETGRVKKQKRRFLKELALERRNR